MSELGDLLELLHGARSRWRAVRLVLRHWSHFERSGQARERWHEQVRRHGGNVQPLRAVATWGSGSENETPTIQESESRMWLDPERDRVRTERSVEGGDSSSVRVGDRWWSYHPLYGATSNEGSDVRLGRSDEGMVLLNPALLLPVLDFALIGEREVAGRRGLVVRATPRELEDLVPFRHLTPAGSSELELVADAERGVLLRLEARVPDGPFNVQELLEVGFDEQFDDGVFVFDPPPGEQIRSQTELHAMPEAMSLEEASRRASFIVLAPTRVPAGWRVDTMWFPGRERPPAKPSVVLHLVDPTFVHRLQVTESTEAIADALDWEEVHHDGAAFLVYQPPGPGGVQCEVKFERQGTQVRMSGNLERIALLDIAASFRPAPPELPPLVSPG